MTSFFKISEKTAHPLQAIEIIQDLEFFLKNFSNTKIIALAKVLGNSNFLARWVKRHSNKALEVLEENLDVPWNLERFQLSLNEKISHVAPEDQEKILEVLLDFKYRQLFRITLRDIGLEKNFSEIGAELSYLACSILQGAFSWQKSTLESQWGQVFLEDSGANHFSVLGMGKLGGSELNFSSDLDLIYFYDQDQGEVKFNGTISSRTPHEYFCKLFEKTTQLLGKKTSEGFLYRIDLELRPEGKAGAMANSLDAMENYYEIFGANWEKQALLKAAWAAGNSELCQKLLQRLHPFIYPKNIGFDFLKDLRNMKEKLSASIQNSSQSGFHIKLGKGGIREIEFFVQSLQILYAGKIPELQTTNTLMTLGGLEKFQLISPLKYQALQGAYFFLRTLENRLQQIEEQQTHRLPQSSEELALLARRMGYEDTELRKAKDHLLDDLQLHCEQVEISFQEMFDRSTEA